MPHNLFSMYQTLTKSAPDLSQSKQLAALAIFLNCTPYTALLNVLLLWLSMYDIGLCTTSEGQ